MSRLAGAVFAVALCVLAPGARAQTRLQGPASARVLLARAESLWTQLARQDSAVNRRTYLERRARRFDAGPVTALVPAVVGAETGFRLAASADEYLRGAVPPAFVASRVIVAHAATAVDSVVRAQRLADRVALGAYVAPRPDTLADGWALAAAIAHDYRTTLDSTWRAWLPFDLGLAWTLRRDGAAAVRELMRGDTRAGADCLEGSVAWCRRWLALDDELDPYRVRYRPEELRRLIETRWFPEGRANDLAHECTTGSNDACYRIASLRFVSPIPAGPVPRSSVLSYVRALPGHQALLRALADPRGPVGERLARAAGVTEDSLVAAWRIWLLTGGGQPRVTADVRDALPALLFAALLLFAATRSRRWR